MSKTEVYIPKHLEPKSQPFGVACSGGVDSMVLLHLLMKPANTLHVLHVNYRLRGKDSDLDQKIVEAFCSENKLPLHVYVVSDQELKKLKKNNLQAKAREIRFGFFKETIKNIGLKSVYLGQHKNDQIETFFLRLFRKSGLRGMQGIKSINGVFIRPLLQFSKENILSYAQKNNLAWREDMSNKSNDYLRNLLRNEAIPLLKNQVPQIEESVLTLIKAFQDSNDFMESKFRNKIYEIKEHKKWNFDQFDQLKENEKIFIAQSIGWSANDALCLSQMRKSLKSSIYLTENGIQITKLKDAWSWGKIEKPRFELKVTPTETMPTTFKKEILYLDAAMVKGELKARYRQEGDRINPVGMTGSQLVSKICKDAKLEQYEKERTIVVLDDENIHWIYPLKISGKAIARPTSNEILKIEILLYD
ncbi:MAG: tRNA lysidine(34) synthetase TilS [Bacteroidetes bacterium]|nr:tRNA lysidine(34) synthetase TilS [Bacteroidota bacterium]